MVTTVSSRSKHASSVRTQGISLLFWVTASCPRTAPAAWSRAATRCGAARSASVPPRRRWRPRGRAPRTVLPSIAITLRPPTSRVRVHRNAPQRPVQSVRVEPREQPADGRLLRSRGPGHAQLGQGLGAHVRDPLPDRGERPRTRDHRRQPHREQRGHRVAHPARVARIGHPGEHPEQVLVAGRPDGNGRRARGCHRRVCPWARWAEVAPPIQVTQDTPVTHVTRRVYPQTRWSTPYLRTLPGP